VTGEANASKGRTGLCGAIVRLVDDDAQPAPGGNPHQRGSGLARLWGLRGSGAGSLSDPEPAPVNMLWTLGVACLFRWALTVYFAAMI
jgi:hypothetical protein